MPISGFFSYHNRSVYSFMCIASKIPQQSTKLAIVAWRNALFLPRPNPEPSPGCGVAPPRFLQRVLHELMRETLSLLRRFVTAAIESVDSCHRIFAAGLQGWPLDGTLCLVPPMTAGAVSHQLR